jgi:hypothetical protein
MADIKQAAEWLRSGMRAKRSTWLRDQCIGCTSSDRMAGTVDLYYTDGQRKISEPFVLMVSDLLTDDWEIA